MHKLALCFAVLFFFAVSGVAQGDMGQSSSSDQSTTSTTKSKKAKSSKAGGGEHQVTGCLAGPNDEDVYTLTNGRYTKGLEVGGNDDLKSHVGHKVTLTGTTMGLSGDVERLVGGIPGVSEVENRIVVVRSGSV